MAFAFEKLLVYQKSVDFADSVCDLTEQFRFVTTIWPTKSIAHRCLLPRTSLKATVALLSLIESIFSVSLAGRSKNAFRSWNSPDDESSFRTNCTRS